MFKNFFSKSLFLITDLKFISLSKEKKYLNFNILKIENRTTPRNLNNVMIILLFIVKPYKVKKIDAIKRSVVIPK